MSEPDSYAAWLEERRRLAGYDYAIAGDGDSFLNAARVAWPRYSGCHLDADKMAVGNLLAERDRLRAEVERLQKLCGEVAEQWNRAFFHDIHPQDVPCDDCIWFWRLRAAAAGEEGT